MLKNVFSGMQLNSVSTSGEESNNLLKRCVESQVIENKISSSFENWSLFNHDSFFLAHIISGHYAVLEAVFCSKQEYGHSLTNHISY